MYQWAPPGGSDSGARGVSPTRRRSGSSASSSGSRSNSSVPLPCSRTSAPSGLTPAGRNWCGQPSGPGLTPEAPGSPVTVPTGLLAKAIRLRRVASVLPELVAVALAVSDDVGRLVLEGVVLQDPGLGCDAAAERLGGGDDTDSREGSAGLRGPVAQHRVALDDALLGTQDADAGAGDRRSPAIGLAEVGVRVGLVVADAPVDHATGRAGVEQPDAEAVGNGLASHRATVRGVAQEEPELAVVAGAVAAHDRPRTRGVADVKAGFVVVRRQVVEVLGANRVEGGGTVLRVGGELAVLDRGALRSDPQVARSLEAPNQEPVDDGVLRSNLVPTVPVRQDADSGNAALAALRVAGLDDGALVAVDPGALERQAVLGDLDAAVIDALVNPDHVAGVRLVDRVLDRVPREALDGAGNARRGKVQQCAESDTESK